MKYRDLVHFEPIQTVKVLREADELGHARDDVSTFVFSDRLIKELEDLLTPHLRFDEPHPEGNKGLFVVANYGTGKTHLMAVISSVAEHADLLPDLTRNEARDLFKPVAGQFQVIRAEIGATAMSLRDIVCVELQKGLAHLGVEFKFPALDQVPNTKDPLTNMMARFGEAFPDRGLLFVLDELLDFLRGRRDAELNLDLRFLREAGEVCGATRLRFMAGIQEALFDNPRFSNVAAEVRRVKDRFEQVRIHREDVAYVVKERLLGKSTQQKDQIRDHLQDFTPLYEGMAENLDSFVEMFPVHPAYIRTFEQITAVEKREVLKTLSQEMSRRLEDDVPTDAPGLVCYDSYRNRLADDPSVRQIPEVREVLEKSEVLRNRVQQALAKPQYVPMAQRIIDGLTVHRLTTDDIYAPIGATHKELRDDLCLLAPDLPERDATFLEMTIGTVIDEILKAVSGQFISENPDNGQVYLDVKKDVDYDQKIRERAGSLDSDRLDEGYFLAMEELLERRDAPYVSGYRIWEYELPWADHRVTRFGYLFFGAPNERSTAQPPRDFYIYFLQPYDPPTFKDEEKADEVFFRLEKPDDEFTNALRTYAGAHALAIESTAQNRNIYDDKARQALQSMVSWLRKNMGEAVSVTYQGKRQPLQAWLAAATGSTGSVKAQVDMIASVAIAPYFESRYPGYPKFAADVTRDNLPESVRQALQHIAAPNRKTDLSTKILLSLELADMKGSINADGRFAKGLVEELGKASGKVVNREDLLFERDPGVPAWGEWFLEPAWLVVVAAALTQLGKAEIGFAGGTRVDALGLEQLPRMNLSELEAFAFIAPPKELPVIQLRAVVKLLGLPEGIVPDAGVQDQAVQQILSKAEDLLKRVADARAVVTREDKLWGAMILEEPQGRDARLEKLQTLLQNVKARNSVGKMNKLDIGNDAIAAAESGFEELRRVERAIDGRTHLGEVVEYLREACEVFGSEHSLARDAATYREDVLAAFRAQNGPEPPKVAELRAQGDDLRRRFAEEAARAHTRDRLDGPGDERKRQILEGQHYADLGRLASIQLLPHGVYGSLQNQLASIGTCKTFDESNLTSSVICPECGYRPRPTTGPTARAAIDGIADDLEQLHENWVKTLLDNLKEPDLEQQMDLLKAGRADAVRAFLSSGHLPSPVSDDFVKALNDVFGRFEVRKVKRSELWGALFPEQGASTVSELRSRFDTLLDGLGKGVSEEKLRIVPMEEENGS